VCKIRVVLADDHHQMIAMVRQTLGKGFEVVGAVEDGKQAVDAVLALDPDVLVVDFSMPVLNGLQAAKQLQTANSRAKIIFLTVYEGVEFVDAALGAGASGYVNKVRLYTDLIPAIHAAMLGRTFISAPLAVPASPRTPNDRRVFSAVKAVKSCLASPTVCAPPSGYSRKSRQGAKWH
jgi:DNA-binding NarL/FixJ family response regulator